MKSMAQEDLTKLKLDKSGMVYRSHRFGRPALWIAGLLLLVVAALASLAVFYRSLEVEVATVTGVYPAQGLSLLNASGYAVAQRKASVSSKATGQLVWLGVEAGSSVKKGEIIARIDDRDVLAAREQAAANLNNIRSALDQALAEQHDAKLNYERNKELLARNLIARIDFDTAEARYKKAQAGVAGGQAAIAAAQAALQGAEVALEYTRIRVPFDAVVLTKDADVGDIITPFGSALNAKAGVVTIADMSSLQVEVDVSEANIGKVKVGQPCEIQLDALPDLRFRGAVHRIVPTADRSKASVMVKVRFLERDKRILPEMSARVSFLARPVTREEERPRLALPPGAVSMRAGKQVVFLVKGNRASLVPIVTGEKLGDMVEVKAGLKEGDKVVLQPPQKLQDGARIAVKEG